MTSSSEISGAPMDAADLASADRTDDIFQLALPDGMDERAALNALYDDLERGERAKAVLAEAEARQIAEFHQNLEHRPIDGLGVVVARIPLDAFLSWSARESHEFWHEQSNVDYIVKRNPGLAPQTKFRPTITVDRELPYRSAGAERGQAPATPPSRGGRWAT